MDKSDFHVGQTVYLLDEERYGRNQVYQIHSGIVEKVGRKILYVKPEYGGWVRKFDMEHRFTEIVECGNPDFAVFTSLNEAMDERCRRKGARKLYGIRWNDPEHLTADHISRIVKIVREAYGEEEEND